jgi:phosphatidylglycerophosphate synthase
MPVSRPPEYRVEDRSILLPAYKRYLIEPLIGLIPDRVSPNTITHAGHMVCLASAAVLLVTWPTRGWPFFVTTALVWIYVWCDNADGAHARRTRQTSALGEFLDHGLDLFNVAYIGYVTAIAIGAPPVVWVLTGVGLPAAAATVYWEQAEVGVFRLGLLNQIESSVALTAALLTSGIWGVDVFHVPLVAGLGAGDIVAAWVLSTIGFGILHGIWRVARIAPRRLGPVAALVVFDVALVASFATGALGAVAVVVVGGIANVAFGLRMLSFRLRHERPRADKLGFVGALFLVVAMAVHLDARGALALAVLGGVAFSLHAALAARTSLRALRV